MAANCLDSLKIAIVDVETTGLRPRHGDRIVEIAILIMDVKGQVVSEFETLVNPERDIGPKRIHGIAAGEVLGAPTFSSILDDVIDFMKPASVIGGHNIRFDNRFLFHEFERAGYCLPKLPQLCSCELLGRQRLEACCEEFGVEVDESRLHSAIYDARITAALIAKILADDPELLLEMNLEAADWPNVSPRGARRVTRAEAKNRVVTRPTFLQRISGRCVHNADNTPASSIAYMTLLDRILEDGHLDQAEEAVLTEAIETWQLTRAQVETSHSEYIRGLLTHALADGVISDSEREELYRVSTILGRDPATLNSEIELVVAQLDRLRGAIAVSISTETMHGKSVCFTGEMTCTYGGEFVTRALAEELAERAGMIVRSSVTKELEILVVADPDTQSSKAVKARKYGVRIVAERVFWRSIGVQVE